MSSWSRGLCDEVKARFETPPPGSSFARAHDEPPSPHSLRSRGGISGAAASSFIPPPCGEGRQGAARPRWGIQNTKNAFDHTTQVSIHITIPEPQNVEPLRAKKRIAFAVRLNVPMHSVSTTVHLNDDSRTIRDKIYDVAADRRLPAETKTERPELTQLHPQFHFLRYKAFAKCASMFVRHGLSTSRTTTPTRPACRRPPSPHSLHSWGRDKGTAPASRGWDTQLGPYIL